MKTLEIAGSSEGAAYVSPEPFDEHRVGAAAVYCSDGRFGEQMDQFLHVGLSLPRYDRVAVPGGAACLGGHLGAYHEGQAMGRQLEFLINEHGLRQVVLIAHDGCAFYKNVWFGGRTVEQQQAVDLHKAAELIRMRHHAVDVTTYFARRIGGRIAFERWIDAGAHVGRAFSWDAVR